MFPRKHLTRLPAGSEGLMLGISTKSAGGSAVTAPGLSEQQRIADAFFAEGLIPVKLDTGALNIWIPKGC
ncbi:hypothetical protein AXW67_11245 [Bradyrhizobium neotropicale]|uniref:Uncharacterized protein n=1 Tax=Bradyrhizobium neotropicale TaxID=1497615 RepID=A0A176ZA90_9BRAD|nr:hypothetical protein AXW67_11245 [Bradyrhizobium neotropicale]